MSKSLAAVLICVTLLLFTSCAGQCYIAVTIFVTKDNAVLITSNDKNGTNTNYIPTPGSRENIGKFVIRKDIVQKGYRIGIMQDDDRIVWHRIAGSDDLPQKFTVDSTGALHDKYGSIIEPEPAKT